jgi:hypothetical protein
MATNPIKSFMHAASPPASAAGAPANNKIPMATPGVSKNPTPRDPQPLPHSATNTSSELGPDFKLSFDPNVLDNYDTYTYHWKFFITSLEDAATGRVLDPSAQTIIAESGVSDLTIDKVEVNGIAVPSVETGTGTQTLIKFEIVEPSGAGLLDKLFNQSVALGIGNWLVMPTFLQLEFRGRNPESGASDVNGGPSGLSSLKWLWPLKLTNTKANVTNVGTRYEFDAIMYNELAQSNSYFGIQHNVVLKDLTTFQSAITDLENKINADQIEKLIDNYSIPDVYNFHVDKAFRNELIGLSDKTKSSARHGAWDILNEKAASFNAGTSIDKIIDCLCGNMEYFQKKMQNSPTAAAQPNTSASETNQMKSLWRIVTETKPIGYDLLRQDNAVQIDIYIVEYDLGMVDVNPSQTGQTPETIAAEKKRFLEYAKKKIMKKKYNYIFTGLNDQIKNLDLNINFAFAASLSRFGGIYYDSSIRDRGVTAKDLETQANVTEQLRKTLQYLNTATSNEDVETKIKEVQNSIISSNLDPLLAQRYTALLAYARSPDKKAYANFIAQQGGINANGALDSRREQAKSLAAPISGTNSNGENINLKFVSDVRASDAKSAQDTISTLRKGKLRPIPYRENMQEVTLTGGVDPDSNAARSRVSSVFATALYSTLDASMQHLKLTIKGDPYWLFPQPVASGLTALAYKSLMQNQDDAIEVIKKSHITNERAVNLFGTDNFVVVRFRTPQIYNIVPAQEVDPYTEVSAFSGVYKVITIVSKFEMGVFSQELTCILDPVIDIQEFLHAMEQDAGATDLKQPPVNVHISPDVLLKADVNKSLTATILKSNIPTLQNPTPTQLVNQSILAGRKHI